MADRVERLTNLLALLLETREPLSLVEIAGELRELYPEGRSARRAAFERDKSALREIGVPIEQEIVGGGEYAGQTRYWIDRDRYELADLDLDEDEMRALQVALAATRPGSDNAQEALWKLGAGLLESPGTGPGTSVAAVVPDLPGLPELREAVSGRRSVSFSYRGVERVVDPWGLLLRSGFWYLVGFDHTRAAQRTYRIDRIEGHVAVLTDTTFERPDDFDPSSAFPDDPKLIGGEHEIVEARVLVDAHRAEAAVREIGEDRVLRRLPDGGVELGVACSNIPAFRSWLLGYLDAAEVVEPAAIRDHVVAWLESVVG
jgi:proteasome accessory factor B